MRKLLAILCASSFMPWMANAEDRACCYENPNHWYLGMTAEAVLPNQVSIDEEPATFGEMAIDQSTGYGFSGLIGYQLFPNAAFELEFLAQSRKIDGLVGIAPNGELGNWNNKAIFLNHRWIYHNMGSIAPYLAAGAGVMFMDGGFLEYAGQRKDLKDVVFAYQFMAGVNFAVPKSNFELYLGYRYIGTDQGEMNFNAVAPGYKIKFDNDSHNVEFGGRLHF